MLIKLFDGGPVYSDTARPFCVNTPSLTSDCRSQSVSIGVVLYRFRTFTGPRCTWVPLTTGVRESRRSVSKQRALPGPSLLSRSHGAAFDVKRNIMSGETCISSYRCGYKGVGEGIKGCSQCQSHWTSDDSPQNKATVLLTSLGMCGLKPNTVFLSGSLLIDSIYNSRKL